MLFNINSKYNLESIFSFIEFKKSLEIIIYNKKLQEKLNININYYKGISQKILKIDKNGIGTIYNLFTNEKYFEGEYSNKKKNGKGIEYKGNEISFEGEYKNGKKNGYGKKYNFSNLLIYEGEYKDDKRNGYGKEYVPYPNLVFEGEFFNDKKWNGILIYRYGNKKILFKGEYKNGKIWNGKGYKIYNNEIDFEIINGNGIYKKYDKSSGFLILSGNLTNGELNGYVKEYDYFQKLIYEGEYKNGIKNGKGKEFYSNGNIKYEGIYKEDMKWEGKGYNINGNIEYEIIDGNGKYKEFNQKGILSFEGEIMKGKKYGYGKDIYGIYDDQIIGYQYIFEGFFLNGKKNGYGKEYMNGKIKYEGNYLNDKRHGHGKLISIDGNIVFEGEFFNGFEIIKNNEINNTNEHMIEYDEIGRKKFEGEYKYGKRNGHGKEYLYGFLIFEGEYLNNEKN